MSWTKTAALRVGAAAAFCVTACSAASAAPLSRPTDAQLLQMISTRVDLQKQGTGIVVGIAESGGNRVISYGRMGLDDNRPVDGRTVFDVGSITKVLTALLLSDMVQHHEVALDDPVGKFFPGATMPSHNGRAITLADLATQTSGLPLRPANLFPKDASNPYVDYSRDALFRFLATFTLTRDPGHQYEYSNVGFGLLGQALSARAHESYSDLIRRRITGPLDMSDTRIGGFSDARSATGYDGDLNPVPHWSMGALESAGAFRSSANDLLKLLDAALGFRKSPLQPALDAMVKTRRPGGMEPATAIALAWNIDDVDGREIVWKNGSVGGFRAFVGYDRAARVGIVALSNAQTGNGTDDIGLHFLDPAMPVDLEIPTRHVVITLPPAVLDQFAGRYRFSPTDFMTVARTGDHLSVTIPGQPPFDFYPENATRFFLKIANVQVTFEVVKDGHATRVIWHQGGQDQIGERVE